MAGKRPRLLSYYDVIKRSERRHRYWTLSLSLLNVVVVIERCRRYRTWSSLLNVDVAIDVVIVIDLVVVIERRRRYWTSSSLLNVVIVIERRRRYWTSSSSLLNVVVVIDCNRHYWSDVTDL